ncbi:SRPBCC family protein [Glaciihabitans sp. dw_435]|uniref:SRPBCC family protein n=1 Tax=Glaciihabitans sp. dw_435 TaxID=2720081 RepID=UPI001BD3B5BB|nr:SRPBCC family protein [Glaciihabitans sp. dw_435]
MSVNTRKLNCSPEDVFAVIADGWLFPTWVVGASRMRDVEEGWPEEGFHLHHSFGVWPFLINDETTMLEWDPPRHAAMRPKGWPIGEALVTIDVRPKGDGCIVRITEEATAGPGTWVPEFFMNVLLHLRNVETLRRLAFIAEGRRDPASSDGGNPGAV